MTKCNLCGNEKLKLAYSLRSCKVYRCPRCELVFTDQNSLKHKKGKEMYSEEFFTVIHPDYFRESGTDYEKHLNRSKKLKMFFKELKRLKKLKPNGNLLDVGCATGVFLDMARREGFKPSGVELSDYAAKYAKEKFKLNVFNGILEEAKFKKKSFDIITMWDFIEHVPDPIAVLEKAKELLKDDGIILIQTVNEDGFMCNVADKIYKLSFGIISKPAELVHPIHHITHFSKRTLTKMLHKIGLKPVRIEYSEIPLENVEGGIFLKAIVAGVYACAWVFNRPYLMKVIARTE